MHQKMSIVMPAMPWRSWESRLFTASKVGKMKRVHAKRVGALSTHAEMTRTTAVICIVDTAFVC